MPFAAGKRLVVIRTDVNNIAAIMKPGNYNADNICPHGQAPGDVLPSTAASGGINTDCLSSVWQMLNTTNAAAGGTSTLLDKKSAGDLANARPGKAAPKWDSESIAAAVALAKTAENLIVCISNAGDEGGEGHDRASIALADDQMQLATAVFAAVANKPGVRATLMMVDGGVIAFDGLKDVPPSILDIKMPGVYGAQAVAETVFGRNVPAGKLPFTMYYSNYTEGCDIDDMSMQACNGRTYRYFAGPVIYPFGHGISGWSEATFSLQWSPTPPPLAAAAASVTFRGPADSTTYKVVVKNTGSVYTADEVVLAFFKPKTSSLHGTDTPVVVKQLFGFERVRLAPGATTTLSFAVNATTLSLVDSDGHTSLHAGQYDVVFSRGCVGCDELVAGIAVEAPQPIRLKTFRKWW